MNSFAIPRAFLVTRQAVADDEDAAFAAIVSARFRPREVSVTEARTPIREGAAAGTPPSGSARIRRYDRERVAVDVVARKTSLLVLPDAWFAGWKATVYGEDAAAHCVDDMLRGVTVPAGHHRVESAYAPANWRAGWLVSLLKLAALVTAANGQAPEKASGMTARRSGVARAYSGPAGTRVSKMRAQ